ncbi:MAG: KpsF/GutQ family sugar-phosphate isomerase [Holosporales bacterium]|jgi:arabinose-5-phosphate isomerase|nr:KpsF/GutQ family sugar-phosphate isomerase [Holosporales bacterium]
MDAITEAKRTISEEAQALTLLSENLPDNFEDALEAIVMSNGRLVVSGIGKSGHIGRKISATMSSLGQKSFFLHPSEAHHGDLGMLDKNDVLLLISFSGEAIELLPVIDFAKRYGIKVISISKSGNSTLSENSDIALHLPPIKEACPLGMAPTVSSTVTLALGDAMAVALLTKRGFTMEQFKSIHPGGILGRKLSFVNDVMRRDIPLVKIGTTMRDAIIAMTYGRIGCIGITERDDSLVGVITDGDLRRHMSGALFLKTVDEVMTKNPVTTHENALISEVLNSMESKKITCIFVVDKDGNKPIGAIHLHDIVSIRK